MADRKNDFTKGSVVGNIMSMALPMTLAQIINLLYNIVDRIYIARIPVNGTIALTGLGLTFPIITLISAFSNLFGMGGAPLCSIARGAKNEERAKNIMKCSYTLLVVTGIILTVIVFLFMKPILYLFGASDITFSYARDYLQIYLIGTVFVMISLGMNQFINAQGFGKVGMCTVLCGAVTNIVLDPILIFGFHMGVQGAGLATVISQGLSMIWVLLFLKSDKAILRLSPKEFYFDRVLAKQISTVGVSGFTLAATNSAVQIVCNMKLQQYGGDLYIGVMTVLNSVRDILTMPVQGISNGAQPVLGYNYGARVYDRVKKSIRFMSTACCIYTTVAWLVVVVAPEFFIRIFNGNEALIRAGVPALHMYFFGFVFMSLQFSGQATFVALGKAKQATFFSIFRKIIIVVPLTMILPGMFGLGIKGVFLAEPISNLVGGLASFLTMYITVYRKLE
ncbi:MAG: MATE family efflux transporter [Anaerostipes sp.]|nr:MATE family efflux transporter [Anaerostipes sp.]